MVEQRFLSVGVSSRATTHSNEMEVLSAIDVSSIDLFHRAVYYYSIFDGIICGRDTHEMCIESQYGVVGRNAMFVLG